MGIKKDLRGLRGLRFLRSLMSLRGLRGLMSPSMRGQGEYNRERKCPTCVEGETPSNRHKQFPLYEETPFIPL